MAEIISFFTLSHALWVVVGLMFVASGLKMYDLLVCDNEGPFFTLKMMKTWMTIVGRAFFYAGLMVVILAVLHVMRGLAPGIPLWVWVSVFLFYFGIGYIIQMVIIYLTAVVWVFVSILVIKFS